MSTPADNLAYRYEDGMVSAGVDEWDNPIGPGQVEVYLRRFRILSETPKGFWIEHYSNSSGKRFVLNDARKKFAHKTIEDAKVSFKARKERQIGIYSARIEQAEQAIKIIEGKGYEI